MKKFCPLASCTLALILILPLTGCVSKSKARAQARRAYAAGHQAGERKAQADAAAEENPIVAFIGPVRNPTIPWADGLTLRLAIVTAGYDSIADPSNIVIHRNNEEIQFNPRRLLAGGDFPLEPGDIVELQP